MTHPNHALPKAVPARPTLTPSQRAIRARIGAYALHAKHDSRELTKAARARFLAKFLDQVDPDRVLPEDERLRRAEHARKAYFARLALQSARARARARHARPASSAEAGVGDE